MSKLLKHIYEREISIGEIFSGGWDIYTKRFKPILIITLLIYIPINIILYFVGGALSNLEDFKVYFDIMRILEALFGIIVTMSIAVIVENASYGEEDNEISWGESINRAFSRWGSCIGTNILAGLIIFGLFLLLIVPGIIWVVYYSFAIQVVILKNLGGKEALDYSKSLVKGQWWRVFAILVLFNFINIIIALVIGFISGFLPGIFGLFTDTLIDIVGAYFTVATTIFFLNIDFLKRKEAASDISTGIEML